MRSAFFILGSAEAVGDEDRGKDAVRFVGETASVGSDEDLTVSRAGGFIRRRKDGPGFALSGGEIEIVELRVDIVGMRDEYVVGVGVPVDDFLAGSNAGKFTDFIAFE